MRVFFVSHSPHFSFAFVRAQSRLTLCDPRHCTVPGSSVHGIFQARILEWVAISFSRGSSQARDGACLSCISYIGRRILYHWATWEGKISLRGSLNQPHLKMENNVKDVNWEEFRMKLKSTHCFHFLSIANSVSISNNWGWAVSLHARKKKKCGCYSPAKSAHKLGSKRKFHRDVNSATNCSAIHFPGKQWIAKNMWGRGNSLRKGKETWNHLDNWWKSRLYWVGAV